MSEEQRGDREHGRAAHRVTADDDPPRPEPVGEHSPAQHQQGPRYGADGHHEPGLRGGAGLDGGPGQGDVVDVVAEHRRGVGAEPAQDVAVAVGGARGRCRAVGYDGRGHGAGPLGVDVLSGRGTGIRTRAARRSRAPRCRPAASAARPFASYFLSEGEQLLLQFGQFGRGQPQSGLAGPVAAEFHSCAPGGRVRRGSGGTCRCAARGRAWWRRDARPPSRVRPGSPRPGCSRRARRAATTARGRPPLCGSASSISPCSASLRRW